MNEYAFETPYNAVHFSPVGRSFTKRLRQICRFYSTCDRTSDWALELMEWPKYDAPGWGGKTRKDTIWVCDHTMIYRLVNEIRRPGRPYGHRMEHGSPKPEVWIPWIKAIIALDHPVDTPESGALIEDILSAMEKAFTPDPKLAPELA